MTTVTLQDRLLDLIRAAGLEGATDREMTNVTGRSRDSVAHLRRQLQLKGLVKDTGRRRYGATVWVATGWFTDAEAKQWNGAVS